MAEPARIIAFEPRRPGRPSAADQQAEIARLRAKVADQAEEIARVTPNLVLVGNGWFSHIAKNGDTTLCGKTWSHDTGRTGSPDCHSCNGHAAHNRRITRSHR